MILRLDDIKSPDEETKLWQHIIFMGESNN